MLVFVVTGWRAVRRPWMANVDTALLFGAMFLAEAALLAWHGFRTRRLHLAMPLDRTSRLLGGALIAYALIGYPVVAALAGQRYPAMPTFGLPCPTTIFTFGVLAWCVRPVPRSVLVVPLVWTLVAMSAAIAFGIVEDFALPIAAVATLVVLLRRISAPPLESGTHSRTHALTQ